MADDKIVLGDHWTEVAVARPEEKAKESLAESVARLAEERRSAETAVVAQKETPEVADYDALGEALKNSPAFRTMLAKKVSMGRPIVQRVPLQKARDWDLPFGPVYGEAGTTTALMVQPRCYFRGEKIIAVDSARVPGTGTRITQILVGRKIQKIANGTLTAFFSQSGLGGDIKMDTCQPALGIAVSVSFVEACTFDMTIFGKAVL